MNLKNLLEKGILKHHKTNSKEMADLFGIVERDLKDARIPSLSEDRKFATIYNAVLQATTALLYCEGYRTSGYGHHANTLLYSGNCN